jgi:hypothetical protein
MISGRDVPIPTMVIPIKKCDTPMESAILAAFSVNNSLEYIRIGIEMINSSMSSSIIGLPTLAENGCDII